MLFRSLPPSFPTYPPLARPDRFQIAPWLPVRHSVRRPAAFGAGARYKGVKPRLHTRTVAAAAAAAAAAGPLFGYISVLRSACRQQPRGITTAGKRRQGSAIRAEGRGRAPGAGGEAQAGQRTRSAVARASRAFSKPGGGGGGGGGGWGRDGVEWDERWERCDRLEPETVRAPWRVAGSVATFGGLYLAISPYSQISGYMRRAISGYIHL